MVVGPECISVVIGPRPLPALRRRAARRGEIDAQIYAPYAPAVKSPIQKAERVYFRLLLGIVGGIVLVALLGWGGLRAYHSWQERHLVRRAAGFLAGGNLKSAALSARRALQLDPESVDAARMMADIAERAADGTELAWRRQVFERASGSIDDAIALVRAALRANDIPLAERTLQSLARPLRKRLPTTRRAGESPKCGTSPRRRRRIGQKHRRWRQRTPLIRSSSRCCS
jgi:hypothetical protein